ncbi:MAG: Rieske 2Fe-2S domain-containing protein [Thermacetogeniaceae bacterium]
MPVQVAKLQDVPAGKLKKIDLQGRAILLINHDNSIYAIEEKCTHRGCSLAAGKLVGNSIECPCHQARFNIISGKVTQGPATKPLAVYQVAVESGMIAINL